MTRVTVSTMSKMLAGVRILVVDDEPDALTVMEDFLHSAGAITRLARSADEALRMLDERIDVIVSDISMPDGDGYQLMRRIRARAPEHGGTTPAVALTAHVEEVDHTRALLAGFQMHLCKPIKAMELVASIHQLLARRVASH